MGDELVLESQASPAGEEKVDPVLNEKMSTYTGEVIFSAVCRVPAKAKGGRQTLTAAVSYQACDSQRCYEPMNVQLEFEVNVTSEK